MADEKETPEENEEEQKGEKKSNKMLMIIIIAILVLIIIVVGIVAYLLLSDDGEEATDAQTKVKEKPVKETKTKKTSSLSLSDTRKLNEIGVLYPLDTFTVNLKSDNGRRYLKVTMDLELSSQELTAELDNKTAVIRDRIIRILISKTLEEVSSRKGKEKLTAQIRDTLNAMLDQGEIQGVYFTEFVIQ